MLKVAFCRLDARDDAYTGYNAASFYDDNKPGRVKFSKELEILQIFLEREYLTRVAALQEELRAKYEASLAKITTHTEADSDAYGLALYQETYEAALHKAVEEFPGHEAEYYT